VDRLKDGPLFAMYGSHSQRAVFRFAREKSEDFGADARASPFSNPKDRLPFLDGSREERVPALYRLHLLRRQPQR